MAAEQRPSKQCPWVATTTCLASPEVRSVSGVTLATYHGAVRIHHIALRTRDVPRLTAFYSDVLGLARSGREPRAAQSAADRVWLEAGGAILMIERAEEDEPTVHPGSSTKDLIAFTIDRTEAAAWLARLADHGVRIEAETAFTFYFRDPDGRRVALSHY
jgi:catechol 2,3-dioxygenase-like lactoylglutathione lyase family enzyme